MRYELRGTGLCPVPLPSTVMNYAGGSEQIRENIRSALSRGLPEIRQCRPHGHTLSIAGGGPSLADTYKGLGGYVGAVNKAHDWLIERGTIPNACALLDPIPDLAHQITPRRDVSYYVSSMCSPAVFNKLKGCHVILWHAANYADELKGHDCVLLGGGTTIAIRWISLGYVLGFRNFELFGVDSSLRGARHHVYDHVQDDNIKAVNLYGYSTHVWMIPQISDFFSIVDRLENVSFRVHGDGLFQHCVRARYPTMEIQTKDNYPRAVERKHGRRINMEAVGVADDPTAFGLTEDDLKREVA